MPYSNSHFVTSPLFGFTVALRVAVVCAIGEAAFVTTVGALGSVLKVSSEPLVVPSALVAEILTW